MNRLAILGVLILLSSAMAEPIPKKQVNRQMPLRDGMKVVYTRQVTDATGTRENDSEWGTETKKTKSNDEGTFFVLTHTPRQSIQSESNFFVTKDRKVFQIQGDNRIEFPQIYQMKIGTEFKRPFFLGETQAELDIKIEALEEIEVLGKKYRTTRFSSHHKSTGLDFRSTSWITDGDGPGLVKQVSDAAGIKSTLMLKEYEPGR